MKTFWIFATVILISTSADIEAQEDFLPAFESRIYLPTQGQIDRLVFEKLKQLGIEPAKVCSDGVFVRRVYLDCIGTLPTAEEAREFIESENRYKRRALINQLLERKEFADYWSLKWGDLLRVKAEFPINLWPNGVQAYHRWIRTCIKENMPYDEFVREMLTASGSNFRVPQVNFYRALQNNEPETIAAAVALTFMGEQAKNWPEDRLKGMAAFFSKVGYKGTAEWKEEIVFFDAYQASADAADDGPSVAIFPNGASVQLAPDADPRKVFADWLITADNPWFGRNITNRIWYWLLGRGIVHEPDDVRIGNRPCNPELLNWLHQELVDSGYDLRHIYRQILNSKTYQLSSISRTEHPDGAKYFASYPVRLMGAEVLIDALCQISGTTEAYSSPAPEPFTFIPEAQRSIELTDGSISSPFLDMFGRPPRDTGFESERNNRITAASRLHLLNSSHVRNKLRKMPMPRWKGKVRLKPAEVVAEIYLTILSRFPTEEELNVLNAYTQSDGITEQDALADLVWALVNSPEFLHRH